MSSVSNKQGLCTL